MKKPLLFIPYARWLRGRALPGQNSVACHGILGSGLGLRFISLIFLFCLASTRTQALQTIYITPSEALKTIFNTSREVVLEVKTLEDSQKKTIEKKIGSGLPKKTWNFYIAKSGSKIDGYALIDNEVGKVELITFMTAINPDGTIKAVEILVYRESHGAEVHQKKFTKQFIGKNTHDPIRLGQGIQNISGATLSARAVSLGVKRDLLLWEYFYGHKK